MRGDYILLPADGYWKFVCVKGQYRFVDATGFYTSHGDAVKEGEVGTSAGTISIRGKTWQVEDTKSTSLNLHMDGNDYTALNALLKRELVSRW